MAPVSGLSGDEWQGRSASVTHPDEAAPRIVVDLRVGKEELVLEIVEGRPRPGQTAAGGPDRSCGRAAEAWRWLGRGVSSKVIVHPPYANEACRRRGGNGRDRSGMFIPQMADKRKQEALAAHGAEETHSCRRAGRAFVVCACAYFTCKDPHGAKERTMSPRKRDATQHAKASKRRRKKPVLPSVQNWRISNLPWREEARFPLASPYQSLLALFPCCCSWS